MYVYMMYVCLKSSFTHAISETNRPIYQVIGYATSRYDLYDEGQNLRERSRIQKLVLYNIPLMHARTDGWSIKKIESYLHDKS